MEVIALAPFQGRHKQKKRKPLKLSSLDLKAKGGEKEGVRSGMEPMPVFYPPTPTFILCSNLGKMEDVTGRQKEMNFRNIR